MVLQTWLYHTGLPRSLWSQNHYMSLSCRTDIGRCNVIPGVTCKYLLVCLIFREPLSFLNSLSRKCMCPYPTTHSVILRSSRNGWYISSQNPCYLPLFATGWDERDMLDAPYLFLSMPRHTGCLHTKHVQEKTALGLCRRIPSSLSQPLWSPLSGVVFGLWWELWSCLHLLHFTGQVYLFLSTAESSNMAFPDPLSISRLSDSCFSWPVSQLVSLLLTWICSP